MPVPPVALSDSRTFHCKHLLDEEFALFAQLVERQVPIPAFVSEPDGLAGKPWLIGLSEHNDLAFLSPICGEATRGLPICVLDSISESGRAMCELSAA